MNEQQLDRLTSLARNLWWSWHAPAAQLFLDLDPRLWDEVGRNPIALLQQLAPDQLAGALAQPAFQRRLAQVTRAFAEMRSPQPGTTWVEQHAPELAKKTGAYLSAEFGLHAELPIYSGGLGILAGDHLKEASDLGLPLVGVSLLYRQGYLRQRINADGWQIDEPATFNPDTEPLTLVRDEAGRPILIEVPFGLPDPLKVAIWRFDVGRIPVYLLDADVEGNPEWARSTTFRLYGGDGELRLRQELILGIGGVRALRALGYAPDYWHANEGHAAFHLLERIRELVGAGLNLVQAEDRVRATTVFTSHTPVPAGHDIFSPELMDRYFSAYWPELGLGRAEFLALGQHDGSGSGFNLTALALRLSRQRNAVSARHGEVTREMWHSLWPETPVERVPITSITNGVHVPTWIAPAIAALLDRHLGPDWRQHQDDPALWHAVRQIPAGEWWEAHLEAKRALFSQLRDRPRWRWAAGTLAPSQVVASAPFFQPDIFTIGFARRFATYKRATLIFHDVDRLARLLNDRSRPVQILFAGKAHPADDGGKRLIQEIYQRTQDPRFGGRIAFVEDYDLAIAPYLVSGVDVWLNNPQAPLEASGTSGMKAAINGVPSLSILDGWWSEAWVADNSNGWGIMPAYQEDGARDATEAELIYRLLESAVVPLFYERDGEGVPAAWANVALEAIRTIAPAFSSRRMLIDYIQRLYLPAVR